MSRTFNRKSFLFDERRNDFGSSNGYGNQKSSSAVKTSITQDFPEGLSHST